MGILAFKRHFSEALSRAVGGRIHWHDLSESNLAIPTTTESVHCLGPTNQQQIQYGTLKPLQTTGSLSREQITGGEMAEW